MKRSVTRLFAAALAACLLAGSQARADFVSWSYNWTPTAATVYADTPSKGSIALSNEPGGTAVGDSYIVATNLKTVSDPSFPKEYFGIVVKQGNKALLAKLNAGLAAVKADGTYTQIYKKWFQAEAPVLPAQ